MNWSTAQSVTVHGIDDSLDDANVTYTLSLTASSTDGDYSNKTAAVSVVNVDNDTAGLSVTSISGSTSEAGSTATFTVRLTSEPTGTVTIGLTGDSTEGTFATPLTFTNADWSTAKTVVVTGVDDLLDDGNITYSVALSATSNDAGFAGKTGTVTVVNVDDDTAGISVSTISGSTSEGGSTAQFSVRLTSEPSNTVSVALALDTTEGSVSPSSPIFFTPANWSSARTVTVAGINDDIDDGDITYSVSLSSTSSDSGYMNKTNAVQVVNIDNDTAGISVSAISGNTSESGGTATFAVKLNAAPTNVVTINLVSSDVSEGTVPASVNFTQSNWSTAQTVTVTGVSDAVDDGNITYSVSLTAVSTDTSFNNATSAVTVVNTDDDTAGLSVSSISGTTNEGGSTATFSVKLTSEPTSTVTISLSGVDASEGTLSTATLTFDNTNWNTEKVVTVTGVTDALDDGDVTYTVAIASSSADLLYAGKTNAVTIVNVDDDTAGISVSSISGNTSEQGSAATFSVRLTSEPTADVTIALSGDDTEGTFATPLTFTSGNWSTAQSVTVTGVNDAVDDNDVTYSLFLGSSSTDAGYIAKSATVSVVNIDDDTAGISTSLISGNTSETGSSATFSVQLTSAPTASVTLTLSGDSSEGSLSSSSLTFDNTNWSVAKVVTVSGKDDFVDDGDVTYSVGLSASSADAGYAGKSGTVAVVNTDNDAAGISVSTISGTTSEAGGTATFTLKLDSEPTATVTISVSSSNASEGVPSLSSLAFTTSDWSVPQTVTVTGQDDIVFDGNIAYSLNLTASSSDSVFAGKPPRLLL